ncbi:hypothetical protein GCM10022268_32520 [Sphingomonas cynarae]|uniref:Lipoprotein n=1 Tax=Sphingomonas cynarae TaxID=930197 RepID=A0ABP7EP45_9SPHN
MALTATLTGCIAGPEKYKAIGANTPAVEAYRLTNFGTESASTVRGFANIAEGTETSIDTKSVYTPAQIGGKEDWRPVVDAGIYYVDNRCLAYLDAIFWANRAREGTSRQLGYIGAASAAALALVKASKQLIGLTPLGITLVDQTVNNLGKGLLFDLPPATVKKIVYKQQAVYKDQISKTAFTTRVAALQAVHGYLSICLPLSIETEVTEAIERADFKPISVLTPELKTEDVKAPAGPVVKPPVPPAVVPPAPVPVPPVLPTKDLDSNLKATLPVNSLPLIVQTQGDRQK